MAINTPKNWKNVSTKEQDASLLISGAVLLAENFFAPQYWAIIEQLSNPGTAERLRSLLRDGELSQRKNGRK